MSMMVNGRMIGAMGLEKKNLLKETIMREIMKQIRNLAMAPIGMPMGQSLKGNLKMVKEMDMVSLPTKTNLW